MDLALEEAAVRRLRRQTFLRVTCRWRPAILAVRCSLIRALSVEVPLLIGIPGGVTTVTTALYQSMHSGFLPRYGEASAYAALLVLAVSLPLYLYYRATKESAKFATITGKGFRPSRIDLGRWRFLGALWIMVVPLSLGAPLLLMLWASFLPIYTAPALDDVARMSFANYASVVTREDTVAGLWNRLLVGAGSAAAVAAAIVLSWGGGAETRAGCSTSCRCRWSSPASRSASRSGSFSISVIPIYGTLWIVVFALGVKFLPYGMRFSYSGLLSIDRQLEECARMCGAGTLRVLWAVVLPLTMPAIVATWIYVFMNAIRDLSTAVLLSGANNAIVSVVILNLWDNGEVPQLAALSILIVAGVAVLGVIFMKLATRHNYKI